MARLHAKLSSAVALQHPLQCVLTGYSIAKQAMTRIFKHDQSMPYYGKSQGRDLYQCLAQRSGHISCDFSDFVNERVLGLKYAWVLLILRGDLQSCRGSVSFVHAQYDVLR